MKKILVSALLLLSLNFVMAASKPKLIAGRILDTTTLKPINHMKVNYDGRCVLTDVNGYFSIDQNDIKGGSISIGSVAFEKIVFFMPPTQGNNFILLTLDQK